MPNVRRLYFYLVALISLLALMIGLIGLSSRLITLWLNARPWQITRAGLDQGGLALWVALCGISAILWVTHWLAANRQARPLTMAGAAEHAAPERKAYFYDGQFGALIAFVLLAGLLIYDVVLYTLSGRDSVPAPVRGPGPAAPALPAWPARPVALAAGALIAALFWFYLHRSLTADGDVGHEWGTGASWRRVYQYLAALLGTGLAAAGAAEFFSVLFGLAGRLVLPPASTVIMAGWREVFAASLSALVIGLPLAWYSWHRADWLAADEASGAELNSLARKLTIYACLLAGVFGSALSGGFLVLILSRIALGEPVLSAAVFWTQTLAPPLAYLPVALVLWWTFARFLRNDMDWAVESPDAAGLRRVYFYAMAGVTVAGFWYGLQQVLSVLLFLLLGLELPSALTGSPAARNAFSLALALLVACGPIWWWHWRSAQNWARQPGPAGHEERLSLMRKLYLYGVVIAAAAIVVITLGMVLYRAPSWLFDPRQVEFTASLVQLGVAVALALAWWIGHGVVMRTDTRIILDETAAAGAGPEFHDNGDLETGPPGNSHFDAGYGYNEDDHIDAGLAARPGVRPAAPTVTPPVVIAATTLAARSYNRSELPDPSRQVAGAPANQAPFQVAVVDGGSGVIGAMLLNALREALPQAILWPIALNETAQTAMTRALDDAEADALSRNAAPTGGAAPAGADAEPIQERSEIPPDALERAAAILGPSDILLPGGLAGEVPPELAAAVMESPARKILLPSADPRLRWVAAPTWSIEQWVQQAVTEVAAAAGEVYGD
jgi:hypothetical protein